MNKRVKVTTANIAKRKAAEARELGRMRRALAETFTVSEPVTLNNGTFGNGRTVLFIYEKATVPA